MISIVSPGAATLRAVATVLAGSDFDVNGPAVPPVDFTNLVVAIVGSYAT
jgi:hypothetical protein